MAPVGWSLACFAGLLAIASATSFSWAPGVVGSRFSSALTGSAACGEVGAYFCTVCALSCQPGPVVVVLPVWRCVHCTHRGSPASRSTSTAIPNALDDYVQSVRAPYRIRKQPRWQRARLVVMTDSPLCRPLQAALCGRTLLRCKHRPGWRTRRISCAAMSTRGSASRLRHTQPCPGDRDLPLPLLLSVFSRLPRPPHRCRHRRRRHSRH